MIEEEKKDAMLASSLAVDEYRKRDKPLYASDGPSMYGMMQQSQSSNREVDKEWMRPMQSTVPDRPQERFGVIDTYLQNGTLTGSETDAPTAEESAPGANESARAVKGNEMPNEPQKKMWWQERLPQEKQGIAFEKQPWDALNGVPTGASELNRRDANSETTQASTVKPEEVSGFLDGFEVAGEQVKLSWDYLLKTSQKLLTTDEEKKKELDLEIDQIGRAYDNIPQTQGLAKVSEIGTNVVCGLVPVIVSSMAGAPAVAAATAVGGAAFDAFTTLANANLEIDSYERKSGKKVDDVSRGMYVVSTLATECVMNVLLSSNILKDLAPAAQRRISSELKEKIMQNPTSQKEFNTMTKQVLAKEMMKQKKIGYVAKNALVGGGSSLALEAEKSFYTGEAPELENIVTTVLTGAASGALMGGLSLAGNRLLTPYRRMTADNIYYASDMNGRMDDGSSMVEIKPKRSFVGKDGRTYVEADRLSPNLGYGKEVYDIENISHGSYDLARKAGATNPEVNHYRLNAEQREEYSLLWEKSKAIAQDDPDKGYAMQNEVVQSVAADIGFPIKVYARKSDLPNDPRLMEEVNQSYGVTVNNSTPIIVLENCQNMDLGMLEKVVRHEAMGHMGSSLPYRTKEDYESAVREAGEVAKKTLHSSKNPPKSDYDTDIIGRDEQSQNRLLYDSEEHIAESFEDFGYQRDKRDGFELFKDIMRRTYNNMHNTTTNEMRKGFKDLGRPMPDLWEIEEERRRKSGKK